MLKMIKNKSCENYEFSEIADISPGIQVMRYQDSKGIDYQVLSSRHLDGLTLTGEIDYVKLSNADFSKYRIYCNDVVMVMRANTGKAALVTESQDGILADQHLAIIRRKKAPKILPSYLVVLLNSEWFQQQIFSITSQSTVRLISISQLSKLEIPVPSIDIQQKIADLFFTLEEIKISSFNALKIRQQIAEASLFKLFGEN
ncbi:MAG: restriction endonuclease subunit S [Pseudanabaena sp. CAN_BIN31]|nr:restriction endonuclease subunit S [Pseudanabaena sp. CAN_BIN31]